MSSTPIQSKIINAAHNAVYIEEMLGQMENMGISALYDRARNSKQFKLEENEITPLITDAITSLAAKEAEQGKRRGEIDLPNAIDFDGVVDDVYKEMVALHNAGKSRPR